MIVDSQQYPTFLEHMIKHFIRILVDGEPYFIAEYHIFVSFEVHIIKDYFILFNTCHAYKSQVINIFRKLIVSDCVIYKIKKV